MSLFNAPGKWDLYLSHVQSEAQAMAVTLANALGERRVWLDVLMEDVSLPAIEEGARCSSSFVALLTPSFFASEACVREFERAVADEARRGRVLLACPATHAAEPILDTAPVQVQVWRAAAVPRVFVLDFSDPELLAVGVAKLEREMAALAAAAAAAAARGGGGGGGGSDSFGEGEDEGDADADGAGGGRGDGGGSDREDDGGDGGDGVGRPTSRFVASAARAPVATGVGPPPAVAAAAGPAAVPEAVVGASDFFIDVTSGSGNQYSLLLRISGASATLTKQNPDGSVTIFKGRAPDQLGMIRLDGIQASNRGAFILGQFPYNREAGKNFKLQANQFANGDQVWDCTFR